MGALLHDYPAYGIFELPVDYKGRKFIDTEMTLAVMRDTSRGPLPYMYYAGSVASYAIENNECPFAARERAIERGHPLYWINGMASVLLSTPRPKEKAYLIEVGMVVHFQGKDFEIWSAPNDNLVLIEVPKA